MSLLDRRDEKLEVFVEVEKVTGRGNTIRVPADTPVNVFGMVHPVSTDEATALGQSVDTVRSFTGRSFPGGPWASVRYDGRDWEVHGEPVPYRRGRSTRHVAVTLIATTPPPIPEDTP